MAALAPRQNPLDPSPPPVAAPPQAAPAATAPAAAPAAAPAPTQKDALVGGTEEATVTAERDKPDPEDKWQTLREAEFKGERADQIKEIEALEGERDQYAEGNVPKQEKPPLPKTNFGNPMEGWGATAMAVAAIGSLFTRAPLTTALNAAAGAMNAIKEQDAASVKQNVEVWKQQVEQADKNFQYEVQIYKDILQAKDKTITERIAEMNAAARQFGNETTLHALLSRDAHYIRQDINGQIRANNQMQLQYAKMIPIAEAASIQASPEYKAAVANQKDASTRSAYHWAAYSGIEPQAVDAAIKGYKNGDENAFRVFGNDTYGKNAGRAAFNAASSQMATEGLSPMDVMARRAAYQGVRAGFRTASTTAARIGLGVAEMVRIEPQVRMASDALKRTKYPTLNALIQGVQKEGGSAELRSLALRLQGLKSAYSQVLTRGGLPTDSARKSADELFDARDPKNVLDAALQAMNDEAEAVRGAPGMVASDLAQEIGAGPEAVGTGRTDPGGNRETGGNMGSIVPATDPPIQGAGGKWYKSKGGYQFDQKNWEEVPAPTK